MGITGRNELVLHALIVCMGVPVLQALHRPQGKDSIKAQMRRAFSRGGINRTSNHAPMPVRLMALNGSSARADAGGCAEQGPAVLGQPLPPVCELVV